MEKDMNTHADERFRVSEKPERVLERSDRKSNVLTLVAPAERKLGGEGSEPQAADQDRREIKLAVYDASVFVGLRTIVYDAAIERIDGDEDERTIELPRLEELSSSSAIVRCLMADRLRGPEVRAMRRMMKLTLADLAKRLDEKTAVQTVSRWESEAQPMGVYVEKLLRLLVCEELRKTAPGIEYNAAKIVNLRIRDPWKINSDYQVTPVELGLVAMKQVGGNIAEVWSEKKGLF
jgi:DNA-binding transcriptional regulator YiaG